MKPPALIKKVFHLPKKIVIPAILVVGIVVYLNFFRQTNTPPLQFTTVKRGDLKQEISASGTLAGKNSIDLKFKIGGKISYLKVSVGNSVSTGDVISGLDTTQLNIDLRTAENTLRDKRAIVDKIHDDLKDHQNDETYAQRQTRTTAEVAQDNAYEGYLAAKRAFQDAVITTPLSGIVTKVAVVVGQTVSATDVITQVIDTSEVYFETDVDETDIGKVSVGLPVDVTLDAYPNKTFSGTVSEILPQTKTTSSGATVVTVRIKLSSPPTPFVNGLSGQAGIIVATAKDALTLPAEAIREDNTVFVDDNGRITAVKVKTGIQSDTDVVITGGLSEGDRVLLNPPALGSRVTGRTRGIFGGVFRSFGR